MKTGTHQNVNEIFFSLPIDFFKRRQQLLELAEKCGFTQERIQEIDVKSFEHAILYKGTYETWFRRYAFSDVPPALKKVKTDSVYCDGCFFDGKGICYSGILTLPRCAGEGGPVIFVLADEKKFGEE